MSEVVPDQTKAAMQVEYQKQLASVMELRSSLAELRSYKSPPYGVQVLQVILSLVEHVSPSDYMDGKVVNWIKMRKHLNAELFLRLGFSDPNMRQGLSVKKLKAMLNEVEVLTCSLSRPIYIKHMALVTRLT